MYAHRSLGCHRLNVREDLGWNEHSKLKLLQFHQYPVNQVHEVELYDDSDVLRQGGSDDGIPPAEDGLGPGPNIESVDSSSVDPADIAVPDDGTDSDFEDGDFRAGWLAEIEADEYRLTEAFHAQRRRYADRVSVDARYSLADWEAAEVTLLRQPFPPGSTHDANNCQAFWEPDQPIELELRDWQPQGYDPASHLVQHASLQRQMNDSDVEVMAIQLMAELMELELPAMSAYCSFPEECFTEANLHHEDVKQPHTITLAVDEHVLRSRKQVLLLPR